jgi:predicted ATPase
MMEPIIRRLIIKRFRSFPNEVATFGNPTFLVGRNGAGKSNFVEIFSFVSEAMTSPLQSVVDRRGGITRMRFRDSAPNSPSNLGIGIDLGAVNEEVNDARFAFEIKEVSRYGFEIVREQCQVVYKDGNRYWYERTREKFETNVHGLAPVVQPIALSLPLIGGDQRFAPVYKALSSIGVYSVDPQRVAEAQDFESGAILEGDGSNAANVLQELERSSPETVARVYEYLRGILPSVATVRAKPQGHKLVLEFVQQWSQSQSLTFDAPSMSEGTLRTLGLILSVFQPTKPSVLVIEEPEATIHPGALGTILDLIRHASRNMQVIVTTHSPDLLDAASWIGEEHLRLVIWEDGASHIAPVAESVKRTLRSHLMGAGEVLRSNALDPAPHVSTQSAQPELFEDLA